MSCVVIQRQYCFLLNGDREVIVVHSHIQYLFWQQPEFALQHIVLVLYVFFLILFLELKYSIEEIQLTLINCGAKFRALNDNSIIKLTVDALIQGKAIGWFQGRMEWGPRALGNRSILADPRLAEMKDILNEKIKHRESFRPFAPSILEEYVSEYFELDVPSTYMLLVAKVKKPDKIPAVTHVDGTARLQSVSKNVNP